MTAACPLTPRKRVYFTRKDAERDAERIRARTERPIETYRCPPERGCGRWHHRDAEVNRKLHGTGTGVQAQADRPGPADLEKALNRARRRDRMREEDPERYREQKRRQRQRWKLNVKNRRNQPAGS